MVGRKAGSLESFQAKYSDGMKAAGAGGLVWDDANIAEYVKAQDQGAGQQNGFPGPQGRRRHRQRHRLSEGRSEALGTIRSPIAPAARAPISADRTRRRGEVSALLSPQTGASARVAIVSASSTAKIANR